MIENQYLDTRQLSNIEYYTVQVYATGYIPITSSLQNGIFIQDTIDYKINYQLQPAYQVQFIFTDAYTKQYINNITFSINDIQYTTNKCYSGIIPYSQSISIYNQYYNIDTFNIDLILQQKYYSVFELSNTDQYISYTITMSLLDKYENIVTDYTCSILNYNVERIYSSIDNYYYLNINSKYLRYLSIKLNNDYATQFNTIPLKNKFIELYIQQATVTYKFLCKHAHTNVPIENAIINIGDKNIYYSDYNGQCQIITSIRNKNIII